MTFDLLDFLAPPAGAVLWLFLSWLYARAISGRRPLNSVQKGMIFYGLWFVLGMGYVIMVGGSLHWPTPIILFLVAVWGVAVALVSFWRYRYRRRQNGDVKQPAR